MVASSVSSWWICSRQPVRLSSMALARSCQAAVCWWSSWMAPAAARRIWRRRSRSWNWVARVSRRSLRSTSRPRASSRQWAASCSRRSARPSSSVTFWRRWDRVVSTSRRSPSRRCWIEAHLLDVVADLVAVGLSVLDAAAQVLPGDGGVLAAAGRLEQAGLQRDLLLGQLGDGGGEALALAGQLVAAAQGGLAAVLELREGDLGALQVGVEVRSGPRGPGSAGCGQTRGRPGWSPAWSRRR